MPRPYTVRMFGCCAGKAALRILSARSNVRAANADGMTPLELARRRATDDREKAPIVEMLVAAAMAE